MKVLLLTTHLEMGGIPVYVVNLAKGLKERGHTPIVASHGGWLERRLRREGIFHANISCKTSSELHPKLWLSVLPKLVGLTRREQPDLIHAHTRVTQVLAWALNTLTGVPYVTTCHGLYRFRIGRRFFRCWGDRVMAISGPSMDRLINQYRLSPPHKVILIRNGVEVNYFLKPVPEEALRFFKEKVGLKGSPIVGAIARLSPVKGLDALLKALPGLLPSFPRLQVLLVGEGPARPDLIRLAYSLGIEEHVVITHPVEDTRVPLSAMDLFVAPSLREGFGLALVEAMAAGVPVVATNAGGPAEIIEDGVSGLLIPPGDPALIGKAVASLLSDPAKRRSIAAAGRERAKREFDMDRVVRQVEEVYGRTLA